MLAEVAAQADPLGACATDEPAADEPLDLRVMVNQPEPDQPDQPDVLEDAADIILDMAAIEV